MSGSFHIVPFNQSGAKNPPTPTSVVVHASGPNTDRKARVAALKFILKQDFY